MSIPASQIVSVTPSVLGAGGNPLALNGLLVTCAEVLPVGAPVSFASAEAVADYFGAASDEAAIATVYFNGYDNSSTKPNALLIVRFPAVLSSSTPPDPDAWVYDDVSAFLRGAPVTSTLGQFNLVTNGSFNISIDGVAQTLTGINLSTATSYSDIAAKVQTSLTTAGTITYSSDFEAYTVTSATTGANSTVAAVQTPGSLALMMGFSLTAATTSSAGAVVPDVDTFMDDLVDTTTNWAMFMTAWEPKSLV